MGTWNDAEEQSRPYIGAEPGEKWSMWSLP
jgi:hypothetical protein